MEMVVLMTYRERRDCVIAGLNAGLLWRLGNDEARQIEVTVCGTAKEALIVKLAGQPPINLDEEQATALQTALNELWPPEETR